MINSYRNYQRFFVFVGKKSDIQIAQYVQQFLNQEFFRLWHNYKKINNARTEERNSYFWGLYRGLDEKLKKTEQSVVQDIRAERGEECYQKIENNFALMRLSDKNRVDTAVGKFFPKLGKAKSTGVFANRPDTVQHGFRDGGKINLRQPLNEPTQSQIN